MAVYLHHVLKVYEAEVDGPDNGLTDPVRTRLLLLFIFALLPHSITKVCYSTVVGGRKSHELSLGLCMPFITLPFDTILYLTMLSTLVSHIDGIYMIHVFYIHS